VWSFPLNRLLNVEAVVSSLPVLAAQVTELADGIFIAMSLNHAVADGATFWLFFNSWSEIIYATRKSLARPPLYAAYSVHFSTIRSSHSKPPAAIDSFLFLLVLLA